MARHIHVHVVSLAVRDAYRGEWTTEVEPDQFKGLTAGKVTSWKGVQAKVISKRVNSAKKTENGTMTPEKYMVTFATVDRVKDAADPARIEREIAQQQRLIDASKKNGKEPPAVLVQRLRFLKEELEKAKVGTSDASAPPYLRTTPTEYQIIVDGRPWETFPRSTEGKRRADMELAELKQKGTSDAPEDKWAVQPVKRDGKFYPRVIKNGRIIWEGQRAAYKTEADANTAAKEAIRQFQTGLPPDRYGGPWKGTVDESANAAGKLSPSLQKQIGTEGSAHREDMPEDVFLEPGTRKYPVKEKEDGAWKYSRDLLLAAAREARMHGHSALAKRADEIRAREFGPIDAESRVNDATPMEMKARLRVLQYQLEHMGGQPGEKSRPLRETVAIRNEIRDLERKLAESNA